MRQILARLGNLLFTAAAAGSLVICALALVFWPAGHFRRLNLEYRLGVRQVGIQTEAGTISVGRYVYPSPVPRGWVWGMHDLDADSASGVFDFGHLHSPRRRPDDNLYDAVWCPHWFVVVVSGALPAVWFARFRRRRERLLQGRCRRCGYDLRASPERCPECGASREAEASSV